MVIYFKDNKNKKWLPAFDQKKKTDHKDQSF